MVEHAWSQYHPILWSVLDQAHNNISKKILHICLSESKLINRNKGVAIPDCWGSILNHVIAMTSPTHATACQEADDGTVNAT